MLFINGIFRIILTKFSEKKMYIQKVSLFLPYTTCMVIACILSVGNVLQGNNSEMCNFISFMRGAKYIQWLIFVYHIILSVGLACVNIELIRYLFTRTNLQVHKSPKNIRKEHIMLQRLSFAAGCNIFICILVFSYNYRSFWNGTLVQLNSQL